MIPFILEQHILFISKSIGAIFVALNVLNVKLQIFFKVSKTTK
jgi:hypothetical protein